VSSLIAVSTIGAGSPPSEDAVGSKEGAGSSEDCIGAVFGLSTPKKLKMFVGVVCS
jgi:hypothetical protein